MTSLPHPSYGQLLLDTEKDHGQENDETLAAYIISGRPPQNHQERMDFRKFLEKQKSIHPSLLYYACLKAYESNSLQWISSALLTVPTATLKVGFENGYIQEINAAINSLDFNQTKEYIQRLAADKPLPDKDINRLIDIVLLQKTRATIKKIPQPHPGIRRTRPNEPG